MRASWEGSHLWAHEGPSALQKLDEQSQVFLRQLRHPGTPGTLPGRPTEEQIKELKRNIQSIASPLSRQLQSNKITAEDGLTAIQSYFQIVAELILIKLANGNKISHDELYNFSLIVPYSLAESIMSPENTGSQSPLQTGSTLEFEPLSTEQSIGLIRVGLSSRFVQGLEVGDLATREDKGAVLTLLQLLTLKQLTQNLDSIRRIQNTKSVAQTKIHPKIYEKFKTLSLDSNFFRGETQQDRQIKIKSILKKEAEDEFFFLAESFLTDAFIFDLSLIIRNGNTAEAQDLVHPLRVILRTALDQSWKESFREGLDQLNLNHFPTHQNQTEVLAHLISGASSLIVTRTLGTHREKLQIEDSSTPELIEVIGKRRQAFFPEIDRTPLKYWSDSIAREISLTDFNQRRANLRSQFIELALLKTELSSQGVDRLPVSPQQLAEALDPEIQKISPPQSVVRALNFCISQPNTTSAREAYQKTLQEFESRKHPTLHITHPSLQKNLSLHLKNESHRALLALKELGRLLRLDQPRISEPHPHARDLNLSQSEKSLLIESLQNSAEHQYPILTYLVSIPGRSKKVTLLDAIQEITHDQFVNESVYAQLDQIIDQALQASETEILKQIEAISSVDSVKELPIIIQRSTQLEILLQAFPSQGIQFEKLAQEMNARDPLEKLVQGPFNKYVHYGFTALLVLQLGGWLVKRASPLTKAILWGLDPLIHGYVRSTIPLIIADTYYQHEELKGTQRARSQAEGLFYAHPFGGSPSNRALIERLSTTETWSAALFWGRVVLDGVFMYIPETRQILRSLKKKYATEQFLGDIDAFHILGLRAGDWGSVTPAQVQKVSREVYLVPEATQRIQMAFHRLRARIQAERTWSPEEVFLPFTAATTPSHPVNRQLWLVFHEAAAGKGASP